MTLHGQTTGAYGSPFRTQTLAGATLVFYPHEKGSSDTSRWGWTSLDALPDGELGRTTVADDGSYEVDLDLDGRIVVVAAEVKRLTYAPDTDRTAVGLLGTGVITGSEDDSRLAIALPPRAYCDLLRALDLWLVAGHVSDCSSAQTPAAGADVTVFDRDLTQDDTLGTDTTDGSGSFEVFFPRATFRQIPALPPPFDSILPHELIGGPDVYFRVELGGSVLLEEDPAMGRTSGRENRPNCTYVELCVEPPDLPTDAFTVWTSIGTVLVPDSAGLNDFDADGFVDSGKLAFTGLLDFHGDVAQTTSGNPTRYRFQAAEWADLGTAPAYPADYAPLTSAEITSKPYGALFVSTGPGPFDFTTTPLAPNPDADGWIDVSQDPNFFRPSTYPMVQVDTRVLVPAIDTSGGETVGAGGPVPAPQQDRPRKWSLVLEMIDGGSVVNQAPVTVHLNNSAAYARLNLQELLSNDCTPITRSGANVTVHPMFSIGHPYLRTYRIWMQRQGGAIEDITQDDHTAHGLVWTDADGESGTLTHTYGDAAQCSYRVWLSFGRRLTNGYGGPGDGSLLRTFCTP